MIAPRTFYTSNPESNSVLSALRQYVSLHPETICLDFGELARRLGHPAIEVEAERECLIRDGLEVRA